MYFYKDLKKRLGDSLIFTIRNSSIEKIYAEII